MNERIRELIRLSAVSADQAEDYALAKGLIEPTEKLDVALFAELIVRECLDILEDEDTHDVYGQPIRLATIRIKKLFGVEE